MRVPHSLNRGWLVLCGLALLLVATPAARAQAPADTLVAQEWVLHPPQPCVDDAVILYVRGFVSTPCDSFIFAHRSGEREVTIRTLVHEGYACFAAPIPFAVPIEFGALPAGPQTITIHHRYLVLHANGTLDSTTVDTPVGFEVTACVRPVPVPIEQVPYVDRAVTVPAQPCPERMTSIELLGSFANGCGRLVSAGNDNGHLSVVLAPFPPESTPCREVLASHWQAFLPVGFLQVGFHHVNIDLTVLGSNATWPPITDQSYTGTFDFSVTTPCDTLPSTPLPFVNFIHVGPAPPDSTPLCAGAPIPLEIGGAFPSDCWSVRGVQLIDTLSDRTVPVPPIVRVIVDAGCYGRPCLEGSFPWRSVTTLPGLPRGDYGLTVQIAEVMCTDSILPGNLYSTTVPFHVGADSCGSIPPLACLLGRWERGGGEQGCNAYLSGPSAELTFDVASEKALSGFQGTLRFLEPGLQIGEIAPIGPASGMHLGWTPTPDGARFVMFADHGAPIPASGSLPVFAPVLKVTAVAIPMRANVPWPTAFHLAAEQLLGSDSAGHAVPDCNEVPIGSMRPVRPPPTALICTELGCDFNGDNLTDVRDLVLMVHCVEGDGNCPSDTLANFDCDGDGHFALGDVLCCASQMLRGPGCPDCPVDSTRASLGQAGLAAPVLTDHGADVTVRLTSPGELGAARLGLRFPTDRYRLAGVNLANGGEWLELHELSVTGATLGLIRLQPTIRLDLAAPLDAVLHLELLPGKSAGGEVRIESGDFSANDGVKLEVPMGEVAAALGGALSLAVSPARPNPTTGETRFAVTLDGDARLEVGIYDIGGRRVAELFHGTKGPGSHTFSWNGRTADGAAVGEGIYFYRVTGAGRTYTGKVALLRAR
jgi:hypothetical protein